MRAWGRRAIGARSISHSISRSHSSSISYSNSNSNSNSISNSGGQMSALSTERMLKRIFATCKKGPNAPKRSALCRSYCVISTWRKIAPKVQRQLHRKTLPHTHLHRAWRRSVNNRGIISQYQYQYQ